MINLINLIAPQFYSIHHAIKKNKSVHYWLGGGRGSTKSSFVSLEIILEMNKDPLANTVVLRKTASSLKDSVYAQLQWAIEILGQSHLWYSTVSPLQLIYIPTGQKILFRGADDPKKIKSIKFAKGFCKHIWFEEVDQFFGMSEIRSILQSLMRGGENYKVFYSYNPPQSLTNWVNKEVLLKRTDKLVNISNYLTVPQEWLGEQFIKEAQNLKQNNEDKYRHEYLGEVIGTGGEVFKNITAREITNEEIKTFDQLRRGIDFGYANDPFTYNTCYYNKKYKKLYIYFEINKVGLSNESAIELIKLENIFNDIVTCDSAEPKSIAQFRTAGLRVQSAKKGPNSVNFGIKFLQDLNEIIIDPYLCPHTYKEFSEYELERDNQGNFKGDFPDKNNHHIDNIRYALESDMRNVIQPVMIKNLH